MDSRIRTIVVGIAPAADVDVLPGPAEADIVLETAVSMAAGLGATLHVVQVFEVPEILVGSHAHARALGDSIVESKRAVLQERLRKRLEPYQGEATIHVHALAGFGGDRLCEMVMIEGADLLIVGALDHPAAAERALGSTAGAVVRRSTVPVLVIRRRMDRPVERVLMTSDLSAISPDLFEAGLDTVQAFASGCGQPEVHCLWVSLDVPLFLSTRYGNRAREAATETLQRFLGGRQPRDFEVQARVRTGRASTEILGEAAEWKPDLVVLGTSQRRGLAGLLLGSTAADVLRGLCGNALVVPASAVLREEWTAAAPAAYETSPWREEQSATLVH
jgi:nucleotide-binding universal stress UspA family protein